MSGFTEWRCVTDCFVSTFDGRANKNRMYKAGEVYALRSEYSKDVEKTELFDLLSGDIAAPVAPDISGSRIITNADDQETKPVESLYQMSDSLLEGLRAEGIKTIGDLRKMLSTKKGAKYLLGSKLCRIGPATIEKFKESLGGFEKSEDK